MLLRMEELNQLLETLTFNHTDLQQNNQSFGCMMAFGTSKFHHFVPLPSSENFLQNWSSLSKNEMSCLTSLTHSLWSTVYIHFVSLFFLLSIIAFSFGYLCLLVWLPVYLYFNKISSFYQVRNLFVESIFCLCLIT